MKTLGLEAKLTLCRRIHKLSGQSAARPCVYRPESVCELNIKPQNKQQGGGGNHARFSSFINQKMALLLSITLQLLMFKCKSLAHPSN